MSRLSEQKKREKTFNVFMRTEGMKLIDEAGLFTYVNESDEK
jgi:hypothetical protein